MALTNDQASFAENDLRVLARTFVSLYWLCRQVKAKSDALGTGSAFSSNTGDITGSDANNQRLISGNDALGILFRADEFVQLLENDQPTYAAAGADGRLNSLYPLT